MAHVDKTTGLILPGQIGTSGGGGGSSVDLSFITASAGDILSGKVSADASGNPVNGTITQKSAATFTPSTKDQSIAAGTYLAGKQTIKGDADLIPENIKKDVKIFNVTGTYEGEASGGTFNLAKVTEYTPYSAALTAVTSIELSGLGILGDPDYDSTDLTNANGVYTVTDETASETNWRNRIYQNPNGYQLRNYYDAEYGEGYWYIRDTDGWEAISYYTTDMLTSGTHTWENWDYGYSCDVAATVNETTIPEQPLVLKGVMAESYVDETWTFADTETTFTGFEETPKKDLIYAVAGDFLIGKTLGRERGKAPIPSNGLVFYAPLSSDYRDIIYGNTPSTIGTAQFTTYKGKDCLYFNGTAGQYVRYDSPVEAPTSLPGAMVLSVVVNSYNSLWSDWFVGSLGTIASKRNSFAERTRQPELGMWYTVIYNFIPNGNRCNFVVYLNGIYEGTREESSVWKPNSYAALGHSFSDYDNQFTDGYIADAAIYNRALTEAEILEIHNTLMADVTQ